MWKQNVIIMRFLESTERQKKGLLRRHIESWQKNIIRIRMQEMLRQSRDLKRLQKHIRF